MIFSQSNGIKELDAIIERQKEALEDKEDEIEEKDKELMNKCEDLDVQVRECK